MNTDVLPYRGNPAGGGYTTVEDLWRFAVALTGLRLLDARHTTMVTSGHVEAGWGGRCVAYGFFERHIYGIRSFGAGGGAPGMSADLTIHPDYTNCPHGRGDGIHPGAPFQPVAAQPQLHDLALARETRAEQAVSDKLTARACSDSQWHR
jgi:hypothetical protein